MNIANKGKIARLFIYICLFAIFLAAFYALIYFSANKNNVVIELKSDSDFRLQLFYNTQGMDFAEENSVFLDIKKSDDIKKYKIALPSKDINEVRLDFGEKENTNIKFKSADINLDSKTAHFDDFSGFAANQLDVFGSDFKTKGNDSFLIISDISEGLADKGNAFIFAVSFVLAFFVVFVLYKYVTLTSLAEFPLDVIKNRGLILKLGINDFKTKYSGSYFGIIWAFVQPICQILVFWFVFEIGLRSGGIDDVPFVLWLMGGLIPWFYFSESWQTATNSFTDYSYLVKKVVFNINILPVVKILSAFFVHCFFIVFMLAVYIAYGRFPGIYVLQILYFCFAMSAYVLSLSLITSSLIVFFKDLGQLMNIILQFGMWLTPIMWHIEPTPWFFKLNPMYYIVQGYRNSLIYKTPFYSDIRQTIYFWTATFVLFVVGSVLLKRLKPHFADVL